MISNGEVDNVRTGVSSSVLGLAASIFFCIVVLQWLLFSSFVLREIAWAYPRFHDQTGYLAKAYELYEQGLTGGFISVFSAPWMGRCSGVATGVLQSLQACVLFAFFGASRLSALSLNLFWFLVFQASVVAAIWRKTKQLYIAMIGIGLLLALHAPFIQIAGISDFRLDFAVFCIFGTFISLVIGSDAFLDRKWSVASAIAGSTLILFRYLTATYLLGIYAFLLISFLYGMFQAKRDTQRYIVCKSRVVNILLSGSIISLITILPLWFSRAAIISYYGPKDYLNPWSMASGIYSLSLLESLFYYPSLLIKEFLGYPYIVSAILLFVASALAIMKNDKQTSFRDMHLWTDFIVVSLSFGIPLALLTGYSAKASHVVGVLIPSAVWFVLLVIFWIETVPGHRRFYSRAKHVLATVILLFGILYQFNSYTRHDPPIQEHQDVMAINSLYDTVGKYSELMHWSSPRISFDSLKDFLGGSRLLTTSYYESHKVLLTEVLKLGGSVFSVSEDEAISLVKDSDFVVLTDTSQSSPEPPYPFVKQMDIVRPSIAALVREQFLPIEQYCIEGVIYGLYMRPSFGVFGLSQDGWVTSSGLILVVPALVAQSPGKLFLSGDYLQALPQDVSVAANLLDGNKPDGQSLEVDYSFTAPKYRIEISLPNNTYSHIGSDKMLRIRLSFSKYFIPKEVGINQDERHLVVMGPKEAKVLPSSRASNATSPSAHSIMECALKGFGQEITSPEPPKKVKVAENLTMPVVVKNTSVETWPADGDTPVHLAYHWIDSAGRSYEGLRTKLPHDLSSGESVLLRALIQAPDHSGSFILRLSMVQEKVAWFTQMGCQAMDIPMQINAR